MNLGNRYNAFNIVKQFEDAVCEYTGAPLAVAVNSCTNALFLALKYHYYNGGSVLIPKRTYVSVPQQIIHAGFKPTFEDLEWSGAYQLKPFYIWDSARRFTHKMWPKFRKEGITHDGEWPFVCVSFHWSKPLGIQQGGMILHANLNADKWLRKARFDGRTEGIPPKEDVNLSLGYHMYMSPEVAAEGLVRLMHLPKDNPDLPNDDYPDLSQFPIFGGSGLPEDLDD